MGAEPRPAAKPSHPALVPVTAYLLLAGGAVCALIALCMATPATVATLTLLGSASFIAAGGFLGETVLTHVRTRERPSRLDTRRGTMQPAGAWSITAWTRMRRQRMHDHWTHIDWLGEWSPAGLAFAGSLIAGVLALAVWHDAGQNTVPSAMQQVLGCLLIVAALPLLWLNRVYARLDTDPQAAAPRLEVLLRVPLVTSAALGVACLIRSLGYAWPFLINRAVLVLIGLIASEIMLRSVAQIFLPVPPLAARRTPATSAIARLIGPRWPRLNGLGAGIQHQFGIDLSRSWALAFLLRASLPVSLGLCLFGWLLTGLTTLGINQRAVYERFGVPVGIEGPGLHVHLPWPFGITRKVELGVVHEIPIVFATPRDSVVSATDAQTDLPIADAEAMPPASVDRLWDTTHPFEASYLIASASNGQQGFQIVNIDLRIVYRTSLSDVGAMAAAYRVADPAALIRAAAGRMLVQHFSRYTLSDVLGENRASFVSSFRTQLQQRLDQLRTGTDIIAVVVEAIHPPPEAARAYHNVQAAEIRADALVSQSRGEAYVTLGLAQQQSTTLLDNAGADAAEQVDQAQAALTLFNGDHRAYLGGNRVFLLERWLSHLDRDLASTPLVIVDHRLNGSQVPTVDLRRFGASDKPVIPAK